MRKFILVLAAAAGVSALAGCSGDDGEKATVESVAYICGIGSTANAERYAGVIESGSDTKVKKDSNRKVEDILVKVGDTVAKDQVLFRYDKAQTELNVEKLKIEIEQLGNFMTTKQAEISTLQKEIDSGQLDADKKTSYDLQIQELNADITETNLSIKSKQAELDSLQNTLNNLEVKAPDEGTIQSINSDDNSEETAFIVIRKTGAFRVKGYVNETNRGSLYEGMEVLIRSRTDKAVQKGNIKNIDLKNPVSGSNGMDYGMESDDTASSSKYPFYIELDSTDGFIMGQHVYIEPDYGQGDVSENTMMLPSYYINEAETSPWVWARDGKERLEKRKLTLGAYDQDMDAYEVKEGLSAGDYIASPDTSYKAGMKCVEFDFSSDRPVDLTFDEGGSENGGMYVEQQGPTDEVEEYVIDEPVDNGPDSSVNSVPQGGGSSGMSPFFGAPIATEGSSEGGGSDKDNAQESETAEEVQGN